MSLLYAAGMYLLGASLLLFLADADIWVGFLLVIDLAVGLIFFVFMLHFTAFLFQKSQFNLTARHFVIFYLFLLCILIFSVFTSLHNEASIRGDLSNTWYYKIQHIDFFSILLTAEVTELNTLREMYFLLNSFEFFVINFSLLFGILGAILLCFLIHRIFSFINFSESINQDTLKNSASGFFIRNQNFITQQGTAPATRLWSRRK